MIDLTRSIPVNKSTGNTPLKSKSSEDKLSPRLALLQNQFTDFNLIAEGPRSIVYQARSLQTDELCALKFLNTSSNAYLSDPQSHWDSFVRQIINHTRYSDPHLVQISDHYFNLSDQVAYYIMPYYISLRQFIDGIKENSPDRMPLDLHKLVFETCLGLKRCKLRAGLPHGNVKPENIFYDPETDTFLLGDWDPKFSPTLSPISPSRRQSFDPKVNEAALAIHYKAPEALQQPEGSNYDQFQADIFSLGICAIEATGVDLLRFEALNMIKTTSKYELIRREIFNQVRFRISDLDLIELLWSMVELNSKERPTCLEFHADTEEDSHLHQHKKSKITYEVIKTPKSLSRSYISLDLTPEKQKATPSARSEARTLDRKGNFRPYKPSPSLRSIPDLQEKPPKITTKSSKIHNLIEFIELMESQGLCFRLSDKHQSQHLTPELLELKTLAHQFIEKLENMALAAEKSKDYYKAIQYNMESLKIRKVLFGQTDHKVSRVLNNIGYGLFEIQSYENALQCSRMLAQINRDLHGNTHEEVGKALLNMGLSLHYLERPEQAIFHLKEGLQTYKSLRRDHPEVVKIHGLIAQVFEKMNREAEAIDHLEQSLETLKSADPIDGEASSDVLLQMGRLNCKIQNYSVAEKQFLQALHLLQGAKSQRGSKRDVKVAVLLGEIAKAQFNAKKIELAKEAFEQAMGEFEDLGREDHPLYKECYAIYEKIV